MRKDSVFDFNTNNFFQQMPHSCQVYVSYYDILPLKEDNKEKSHESLLIFYSNFISRFRTQEVASFSFSPKPFYANWEEEIQIQGYQNYTC